MLPAQNFPLCFYLSSSQKNADRNALRTRLLRRLNGNRNKSLFTVVALEAGGSDPLGLKHKLRGNVRDCTAIIMILHAADGMRPGIEEELRYAREFGKRTFLFFEKGADSRADLRNLIDDARKRGDPFYRRFSKDADLPALVEQSIYSFVQLCTRDALEYQEEKSSDPLAIEGIEGRP